MKSELELTSMQKIDPGVMVLCYSKKTFDRKVAVAGWLYYSPVIRTQLIISDSRVDSIYLAFNFIQRLE